MIISDFDDIDKNLVDTDVLFRTLTEFKAVEDITKEDKSDIYNRYTGFWVELGMLYKEFRRLLQKRSKGYEGMANRQVAENIESIVESTNNAFPWDKVVFCGFNALTKSQEKIIHYLLNIERADIFWDMDRYFCDNPDQEAGLFFRENVKKLNLRPENVNWVEDRMSERKNIEIVGVQSKVSQAKVLGIKLLELEKKNENPETAVVVLPDETLLFPVLNSLPESIDQVNVTLGYPLQQTPIYSFFDSIMELILRTLEPGAPEGFYYQDIQDVLNHPYIKPLAPEEIGDFISKIKKENLVYITPENIPLSSPTLHNIFKIRLTSHAIIDFFLSLLDDIRAYFRENKPDLFNVDYEYMYHFYTLMSRLKDILKSTNLDLNSHAFRRLFTDYIKTSRIPFTGEPLVGLQVMGILETQTLDFSHLFVLSVNEGLLPPGKSQQSFIPFDVRCALGLPTYKERDAIAAYHFYRLLKNSRDITLIYVMESKGIEKNEKSRFIDQILIEFTEANKNTRIRHEIIDFPFETHGPTSITVQKDNTIIDLLSKKSYSASSLLNYLSCSLKFYFTYILKLQEDDEVFESPDYRMLGNIVHHTLEQLYSPFRGKDKPIGTTEIEEMKRKIESKMIEAFREEIGPGDITTGRNKISFEVMKKFVEHFFDKEKQRAGFHVVMLEKKLVNAPFSFSSDGMNYHARLEGTIDRLDQDKDGVFCIIDYKTGKINSLSLKSPEELVEKLKGDETIKRKEIFQLFFYRFLLKKLELFEGEFRLGIYSFKKMYDELVFVKIDDVDIIDEQWIDLYEGVLKAVFREIFDLDRPFAQTDNEENCRGCQYKNICGRVTPDYSQMH